jgi:hypothetical protein
MSLNNQQENLGHDLNQKYEQLLSKISKKTGVDDVDPLQEKTANRDDRLKQLYDASLQFKNQLANSRQTLRQLESQTNSFELRCSVSITHKYDSSRTLRFS